MSAYTGDIVKDGLTLYLDAANYKSFVSGSTTWYDLARPGFTGSLINGPTYNNSNKGSVVFDGTNDYVACGGLGTITSFTVFVWFYPTSISNYKNVLDCNYAYNGTTGNIGPRLEMDATGTLGWVYSNVTNNNNALYFHNVVASGLANNTWHCAAITYNGTSNSSVTYYNGNDTGIARGSVLSPTGFIGVMNNVNVGRGFSLAVGSERVYAGRISQVLIYNRALSAAEVRENYNATKGRYDTTRSSDAIKPRLSTSGLVLHLDAANYRSYTGSGIIWRDLSGKGNDAALNNGPVFNSGNGGHFVFDGSNDYAGITNPSTLNMGGKSFTADIWIAVSTTSGGERMIFEYNIWPNQGTYQVSTFSPGNAIVVNFPDANTAGKALNYTYTPFTNGAWTNVVGQFDTVNNTISLYINGSRVAQNTAVTQEIGNAVSSLHICSRGGTSLFLPCKLASLKIYDRALSADEILQNFNYTKVRYGYVL